MNVNTVKSTYPSYTRTQSTRERMKELEQRVSYLTRDKEVHLGLQLQEFSANRDTLVAHYEGVVADLNNTIKVSGCYVHLSVEIVATGSLVSQV